MMLRKILIVKIGAIGDLVMSLPLLSALEGAEITWVAGEKVAPLIQATKKVQTLLTVNEEHLLKGSRPRQIITLLRLWSALAGRSFDLILTLHPDPRYRWIAHWCRTKDRRQLDRRKAPLFPIPGRYHAEEYLRLLTREEGPRTFQTLFPRLHLPPPPSTLPSSPFIVFAPGGAKNTLADNPTRRWPIAHYKKLMEKLDREGWPLVVTGAPSDSWVRPHLSGLPYLDLIGSLSLLEMVSLLEKASLLITHDSGPLHLAKLTPCPILALFGPTQPSEFVGRGENVQVLWGGEHLSCRPCYDGKNFALCQNNLCLQSLSPDLVFQKAKDLL